MVWEARTTREEMLEQRLLPECRNAFAMYLSSRIMNIFLCSKLEMCMCREVVIVAKRGGAEARRWGNHSQATVDQHAGARAPYPRSRCTIANYHHSASPPKQAPWLWIPHHDRRARSSTSICAYARPKPPMPAS